MNRPFQMEKSFPWIHAQLKTAKLWITNVGGNPLTYTQGNNQIIRGVESAVEGLEVGQAKQAVVPPTQGYGDPDPGAFHKVPKEKLPQEIQVALSSMGKTPAASGSDRSCQPSRTIPFFWISTILLLARHCTST